MTKHNPPKGIQVGLDDVGAKVIYRAAPNYEPEYGYITSVQNPRFVFVRYGQGSTSARTDVADLDWDM